MLVVGAILNRLSWEERNRESRKMALSFSSPFILACQDMIKKLFAVRGHPIRYGDPDLFFGFEMMVDRTLAQASQMVYDILDGSLIVALF